VVIVPAGEEENMKFALAFGLLIVLVALIGWLADRYGQSGRRLRATQRELDAANQRIRAYVVFLDDLRNTAWDHRELGSDQITNILLDEIRQFQRPKSLEP
jgi:hypothetical protein